MREIIGDSDVFPEVDHRTLPDMVVNAGALKLALNVLRRAGKTEVADELEKTAVRLDEALERIKRVNEAMLKGDWKPVGCKSNRD